ncbi:TonB-dependent receptor [Marinigracilibium pacificum]|uniref:TonB-dependent receptor n=1 Tax=Marinigracilibium pacificum TaxID=2729599 RepID=A0A848IZT8_9BACT|nr:TonB-dependent receptor [Marinigracilibium pacificum]NMM47509.1 TonB-dependent receptor [Marinigracilibium pacificum]
MKTLITLLFLISISSGIVLAQTQTIKGSIQDVDSKAPLIGASVIIQNSDPIKGAVTDIDGQFRIEKVSTGRKTLVISFIGYKPMTIPNVLVTSGKEVILQLELEESVEALREVVVTSEGSSDLPLNELAKNSATPFTPEEVTRFSGGRNDVARLATSFAGVSAPNDSRNDIVVRGNSPTGLLWRVEGIPVATTNHFSTFGTTGGPVSALNTNLLRTSDFLSGAFPAEYGNANAAVFDINYRNGNQDKFEFTGQLSAFSGLEFMAEGPFRKSKGGSFVASYRYGIASLAATGTSATPYYQDLNFKVNFGNGKLGRLELFGMGGTSSIDFLGDEIDENDLFANPNEDAYVENKIGLIGISHSLNINKSTYIKTSIGQSIMSTQYTQDNFVRDENNNIQNKYRATEVDDQEGRFTITSTLNKKFNAKWKLRAGLINEYYSVKSIVNDADDRPDLDLNGDGIPDKLMSIRDVDENYNLTQLFAQVENNITDNLSITYGIHSQFLGLSNKLAIEPRAAISYTQQKNTWSLSYGLHSQVVPSPILFYNEEISDGVFERTNENLDFMKSHHFVLGYNRYLGTDWRVKSETYYQRLFDIPVEQAPSSYSVINEGADFVFSERGSLVNEGTGNNYGVELTLEKFFSKEYYLMMTTSIFESNYQGSDGITRNTAYNTNLAYNLLFGKEWAFGSGGKNAWTFDTKLTYAGGKPYTPIDLESTIDNGGREIYYENQAYSMHYDPYVRWDVKFGVRINSKNKNMSHQFYVDLQNVLNRENEFVKRYNEVTGEINTVTQNGFFPDVLYRIRF